MEHENKENNSDGWTSYGKLVLKELNRLNEGQENLRKEMDERFQEINTTLADFKNTIKDVKELKEWKDKVTDVWSPPQMKESKDEVYNQKHKWSIVIGVGVAVQIVWAIVLFFKDKII